MLKYLLLADFGIKFLKFFTVGGFGFGVDMLTTWLFKEKLKLEKFLSNSLGFMIGIAFRYVVNRAWTFQSTNPNIGKEFIQFALIGLVGLAMVNGLIYIMNVKWKWEFYRSKVISMCFFFLWNFSANYFWTFA